MNASASSQPSSSTILYRELHRDHEVTRETAIDVIKNFDGIEYWDDPLPTPLDAEGRDDVLVSRMREGLSSKKILNFWVVSDNLLKGAALNAVQIAKYVSEL